MTLMLEKGTMVDIHEPIIKPLQEKIVSRFRINPWLSWLVIGELLGGVAYVAVLASQGTMAWIGQLALMYAIVMMMAGAGPIWVRNELDNLLPSLINIIKLPPEKIKNWYVNELVKVFSTKGMVITGIVVTIAAMTSFIYQTDWYNKPQIWWGTPMGNWIVTIVVSILMFFLGMVLHILFQIALMIQRFPNLPLEMTIYHHPFASISAVGTTLQRISTVLAIGVGLISLTAYLLSPFRAGMGWILIGWLIVAGCIVVIFFLFPQYRIHIAMVNAKANKIRAYSPHLSYALEKAISEPSSGQVAYVKELFELYKYLTEMPEWPFNTRVFITLISAVIIPIILSIVQYIITN
jgi:hypothetical protein